MSTPVPLITYSDEEIRKALQEYAGSGLEDALLKALQLPVEERKAFIEGLSKSYGERRADLRSEMERNYDTMMGPTPQGQMGSNNPFGYYVGANPLEHIASGMMKYRAGKDIRNQPRQLEDLAKQEEDTTAFQKMAQAEALRRKIEEERLRASRMMGSFSGGRGY